MSNLVLIVTGCAQDAKTLRNILPQAIDGPFDVEWVSTLAYAMQRVKGYGVDIVLMDFFLPDSKGMHTFDQLFEIAAPVPIMTLVSEKEMDLAQEAVQHGAQGYILKGHFHNALLPQALRNTIQRKQVEDALFIEKERAAVTLDSIVDGVISTDSEGRVSYINHTAERMTGWSKAEAAGHPIADVFPLVDNINRKSFKDPVAQVIQERRPLALRADALLVRRDGQEAAIEDSVAPIYDRHGKIRGAVIVFRDIGPAQALMVQKMTYQAHHDSLTNLPNRILLIDRLDHAIALSKRNGKTLAVLFLDLDNFKNINDSHGHAIGDQLLTSVAKRLLTCIRASDTVSRLGGDEFVILVFEERQAEAAAHTAEKIIDSLAQPHRIQQHAFHATASIGISTFPADGQDADTLIRNADTAMYYAKKKGRNNFQFFNSEMNRRAVERQFIEVGLRHALEAQEFSLYYQPKVNLKTGKITGVEALLRWHHPERGLVLPGDFVSIAEDCGLIVRISSWVLREACRQTKLWVDSGFESISTAVNISALAFHHQNFLQDLQEICGKRHWIRPVSNWS